MRPNPTEKRCDKTKPKGKSPKHLILRMLYAFLRSVMRERERGITPPSPLQHSTPYNQTSSFNVPYTTHKPTPLSLIRHISLSFLLSIPSTISSILTTILSMFSIPFIYNIPPNCATPSAPPPESPPLSPYLQSYIRRPVHKPSTPSIHYPYAYSLNTFLIVLFSYSIPPSCQAITLQFTQ